MGWLKIKDGKLVEVPWSEVPEPEPYPDRSRALPADGLSWGVLVAEEPALAELERELRAIEDDPARPAFCANLVWYGREDPEGRSYKERLHPLVGWEARNPKLRSEHAYDLAYDHLYALLPDCRDCLCA
jgi:hypothetical protein